MNLQKAGKITKLEQELHLKNKMHSWILGRLEEILTKIGSSDTLSVIYIDIWQRIVESQRRNETHESTINVIR